MTSVHYRSWLVIPGAYQLFEHLYKWNLPTAPNIDSILHPKFVFRFFSAGLIYSICFDISIWHSVKTIFTSPLLLTWPAGCFFLLKMYLSSIWPENTQCGSESMTGWVLQQLQRTPEHTPFSSSWLMFYRVKTRAIGQWAGSLVFTINYASGFCVVFTYWRLTIATPLVVFLQVSKTILK